MKHKNNITDENYEEVVLRRAINICWVLLAICFVVKIFGGNFFDIVCNNEKFVEFCSYVDNHLWCKIIIGSISSILTYSMFYLAILRKIKFSLKEFIFVVIECIAFVILRLLFPKFQLIYNIIQHFIIPFFFARGQNALLSNWFIRHLIYGNVLNFTFQIISVFVKAVPVSLEISKSYFVLAILSIDMIIMFALYYLYANKKISKRRTKMGWFLEWLMGKSNAQLSNMKATRLAKIERIEKEIEAIDAKMKENESKN